MTENSTQNVGSPNQMTVLTPTVAALSTEKGTFNVKALYLICCSPHGVQTQMNPTDGLSRPRSSAQISIYARSRFRVNFTALSTSAVITRLSSSASPETVGSALTCQSIWRCGRSPRESARCHMS